MPEEDAADLEEAGRVAARGDEPALIAILQPLFASFDEYDAQLRSFGFQVCGYEASQEEGEE